MKNKILMFAVVTAMSHSALAQTSSVSVPAAPAAAANTNTATDTTAAAASSAPALGLKYLGVLYGPSADFSGSHTNSYSAINKAGDMFVDNRPKLLMKMNPNLDLGFEARVNTIFAPSARNGLTAKNGNYRLLANIKNVYKNDTVAVSLIPRVVLPTSMLAHNRDLSPSPEMLVNIDIAPKNTRFSFNAGTQFIQYLYGSKAQGDFYTDVSTAVLAPWAEVDYQLTDKTQINLSYWPELDAMARQGTPLATVSNEIDLGATYEVIKGWNVSPFITAQPNDFSNPKIGFSKALNVNLAVSGTFL